MVTLVGTQVEFRDALVELLELEYDAIGAYKLAIQKLSCWKCRTKMEEFLLNHKRHIDEIKTLCLEAGRWPDSGDLIKGTMTKLKVALANLSGLDVNVLKAMLE